MTPNPWPTTPDECRLVHALTGVRPVPVESLFTEAELEAQTARAYTRGFLKGAAFTFALAALAWLYWMVVNQ